MLGSYTSSPSTPTTELYSSFFTKFKTVEFIVELCNVAFLVFPLTQYKSEGTFATNLLKHQQVYLKVILNFTIIKHQIGRM
jgi:hypothetical protein